MSKADEADDLYADLYGEEAGAASTPTQAPSADSTVAAPAPSVPAPAAAPAAPASGSFIPGSSTTAPLSPEHVESAEDRTAAAARGEHIAPQDLPDEGKMFVGGLNWDTSEESLRKYFGQFGPVSSCTVMRDGTSGRSRGFAFVTFSDPKSVNAVMVREHYLDGKIIDPKRAIPRPEQSKTQKCFVGGLPQTVTQDSFKQLFQQFGHVLDSTVMMDKDTGRPRGFGFVTFESDDGVERTLANQPLMLDGKQIEVKRAQSRGQPAPNPVQNRYGTTPSDAGRAGQAPIRAWGAQSTEAARPATGGAQGNFDPQAMAKMYQQMGWGSSAWNPQMVWQQMMSAYMGGGGAKPGWNPAAMGGNMMGSPSGANTNNAAAAYMRAYSGAGGASSGQGDAGASGWNARGNGQQTDDPRGRSANSGSSGQRERSPVRGSRNYDERSRF
ncbi:hypothetical protein MYAM1_000610 [Malassezia yamatoensis]|uniref:RRM domain-containing protein n=1 Tax=Malassezia yamatoensis TaxID=253288 RepID=A0AAJ6CGN9_9BASI|nr:hypothetical protein MYAM1_000610 [Malassezia yamatoensis]